MERPYNLNALHPAMLAGDALITALGQDTARVALEALRADWLTPSEAEELELVAAALAFLLDVELPGHREPHSVKVVRPGGDEGRSYIYRGIE